MRRDRVVLSAPAVGGAGTVVVHGHWRADGERGDQAYFHNPVDYVPHLDGDHLDWLRSRVSVQLPRFC